MVSLNGHNQSRDRRSAIVIGGGLAGLAAAVELASHGVAVTIVERNTHLGGKMNLLQDRRFSFDMGPTIITLPQVLRGIIERSGRRTEDYLTLVNLDPQWRCFYEDRVTLDLWQSPERMARAVDERFPGSGAGAGYLKFLAFSRRMMRLSEAVFFYKDVGSMRDLARGSPVADKSVLLDVLNMRLHATVGGTVHKMVPEPHVRQLCEHFLQYVGSSPFLSPAILSLIAAAQADGGCWYPMGGTRQVARSLERLADELGVTKVLGVGVRRILERDGRANGVELDDGRTITADAVVSNCDVQRTNRWLLGTPKAAAEASSIARKYTPACSGVVLYLGLNRQYDHLAHHNFLFSRDSHEEFGDIYTRGIPARDPTLYLAVPSRTDDTQAPAGGEALYVLVHTPYLRPEHRWREPDGSPGPTLRDYKRVIIDKLKRHGMPDLEEHIVVDEALTPTDIDRMYNAEGGAIYGLASHGRLVGGFKPRNRSPVLKNLYLAGGSANPGPGVPMVLMSGVTAAWSLCEDAAIPVRRTLPSAETPRVSAPSAAVLNV